MARGRASKRALRGSRYDAVGRTEHLAVQVDRPAPSSLAGFAVPYAIFVLGIAVLPLRRALISSWIMRLAKGALPSMGKTEKTALEAGTVWWDGELFSGHPRWKRLLEFQVNPLSQAAPSFLDGAVDAFDPEEYRLISR